MRNPIFKLITSGDSLCSYYVEAYLVFRSEVGGMARSGPNREIVFRVCVCVACVRACVRASGGARAQDQREEWML